MLPGKIAHQKFVEIRIEQGPDIWINAIIVIVDAFGDINRHGDLLFHPGSDEC
jgi:hypothetical protein